MINVAILGASGYTGFELLRILANHPNAKIIEATSRQYK
ncbi:MAG TPA: N-acetyl-gamma-glutamyl-phosphate reductase, partial [Thermodesulfobacteriota bacterium]|nr:N-acetyl-gamma-glutamyl-phosphate reductase [Thermodesulfobacteriota bacterium]